MKQSGLCRGRKQRKKKKEDGGGGGPPTDKSSKEGPKKSGETTEPEQATPTEQGSSKSRMGSSIKAKKKSVNKKRGGWKTKSPEVVKESSKEKSKKEKSVKSRKKKKEKKQPDENGQLHPACSQLPPEPPREPASLKAFPLRAVKAAKTYHEDVMKQSAKTVHAEWQQILSGRTEATVPAAKLANSFEPTVPCIESTRLKTEEVAFYHANWFSMPETNLKDSRFILAQAPTTQGIEAFWKTVFHADATLMFLLTPFYEDGHGCDCFFPLGVGEYKHYGQMFVHNKKKEKLDFGSSYTFDVLPAGCSNAVFVRVVHFEQWEPGMTPGLKGILSLMQTCRCDADSSSPIVCVSRKGTGRPAVLVAAVVIYNRLLQGHYTPAVEVVTNMRKQRAGAVENLGQYCFINCAVASYIQRRNSPSQ